MALLELLITSLTYIRVTRDQSAFLLLKGEVTWDFYAKMGFRMLPFPASSREPICLTTAILGEGSKVAGPEMSGQDSQILSCT